MLKSVLLSSCVALAAIPAAAVERAPKTSPVKAVAPVKAAPAVPAISGAARWAGLYAGAHAGGGSGDIMDLEVSDGSRIKFDNTGPLGGLHAGYDFTSGPWVFGIEGEFNLSNVKGSKYDPDADDGGADAATLRTSFPWIAAIGPRVGYAVGDALIHVSAGVAAGETRYRVIELDGDILKKSEHRFGWSLGAGVAYALDKRWSVRADYRYFNLGAKTYRDDDPDFTDRADAKISADVHAVRLGLTYSFGAGR